MQGSLARIQAPVLMWDEERRRLGCGSVLQRVRSSPIHCQSSACYLAVAFRPKNFCSESAFISVGRTTLPTIKPIRDEPTPK